MSRLDPLLELQDLDTTADQLRHKAARLPERTELEEQARAAQAIAAEAARVAERREVIARDLRRLEDHVTGIEEKRKGLNEQLYGQSMTSPKEAMTLQEELEALARRQRGLEDEEIELMELAEPLDAEAAQLEERATALTAERAAVEGRLADAEAEIAAELSTVETTRAEVAAGVAADLIELYEDLRKSQGGIAVARLVGASCQGCHLALPAASVARIKRVPADEPAYCDECGRLLVR